LLALRASGRRAVLGESGERENASALRLPDAAVTLVLAPNLALTFAEPAKERRADVVASIPTRRIRAGNDEQRRRARDDEMPYVRDLGGDDVRATLPQLDAASDEVGDDIEEARSLVLPTTTFGESLRSFASTVHVRQFLMVVLLRSRAAPSKLP
jgi:hypothetical protein